MLRVLCQREPSHFCGASLASSWWPFQPSHKATLVPKSYHRFMYSNSPHLQIRIHSIPTCRRSLCIVNLCRSFLEASMRVSVFRSMISVGYVVDTSLRDEFHSPFAIQSLQNPYNPAVLGKIFGKTLKSYPFPFSKLLLKAGLS
jgi:hypothetical protein